MKDYRRGFPMFYLHKIKKDSEKRPTCIYSIRIPNFIYYSILRDLLNKINILSFKILRCAFRQHTFQHNCQVAAPFESEPKHFHSAPAKPRRWASPRCHLHDGARSSTSPWLWHAKCLVHPEHVENALGKGPCGDFQCASPDKPPLQKLHRHLKKIYLGVGMLSTLLTPIGWIQ